MCARNGEGGEARGESRVVNLISTEGGDKYPGIFFKVLTVILVIHVRSEEMTQAAFIWETFVKYL